MLRLDELLLLLLAVVVVVVVVVVARTVPMRASENAETVLGRDVESADAAIRRREDDCLVIIIVAGQSVKYFSVFDAYGIVRMVVNPPLVASSAGTIGS